MKLITETFDFQKYSYHDGLSAFFNVFFVKKTNTLMLLRGVEICGAFFSLRKCLFWPISNTTLIFQEGYGLGIWHSDLESL